MVVLNKVHKSAQNFRQKVEDYIKKVNNSGRIKVYNELASIMEIKPIGKIKEESSFIDTRIGALAYEAHRVFPEKSEKILGGNARVKRK